MTSVKTPVSRRKFVWDGPHTFQITPEGFAVLLAPQGPKMNCVNSQVKK